MYIYMYVYMCICICICIYISCNVNIYIYMLVSSGAMGRGIWQQLWFELCQEAGVSQMLPA